MHYIYCVGIRKRRRLRSAIHIILAVIVVAMEYAIIIIILAVLKESYPLNPDILKYDQYMKDFETTGRHIKQEANNEKIDGSIVKREDAPNPGPLFYGRILEIDFIVRNGNEEDDLGQWKLIRTWLNESDGEVLVKEYCAEAHKKYGLGLNKTIEKVSLDESWLKFRIPKYKPMKADVLTYEIDLEGADPQKNRKCWHIMEGQRPDSVWYLEPLNDEKTEFELREQVFYVKY